LNKVRDMSQSEHVETARLFGLRMEEMKPQKQGKIRLP
jgi:hypothetical protein